MKPIRLLGFALATFFTWSLFAPEASWAQSNPAEYKLKVAYIYNFCNYIEWPATAFDNPESPVVIGVLGPDPFESNLDDLAKKKQVQKRKIEIKRFASEQEFEPCHLLFISVDADPKLRDWAIENTSKLSTLLVGESKGFAAQGADVNFFLDLNGTIGFEMNAKSIDSKALKVNARLAKIATIINP